MPLIQGYSKDTLEKNYQMMVDEGKKETQAWAIAYDVQRKAQEKEGKPMTPAPQTEALKSFLKSLITDDNHSIMEAVAYGYASIFEEIESDGESITIPLPTDPQDVEKVEKEFANEMKAYKDATEVTKGAMAAQTQAEQDLRNKTQDITDDYQDEKKDLASEPSGVL